ncbi:protein Dek isoform X2 [Oratosquilla oratoria]|uniref:protein Dek isoform X2 n=1 Tax=Oratosquilla oratoria TaxID=337810 RepID=UPI003F75A91D
MSDEDSKLQLDESINDVEEDAETEDVNKTEKEEEEKTESKDEEMEDDVKEEDDKEDGEVNEDEGVKEEKTDDKIKVATPKKNKTKTEEESTPEKPGVPLYDQPLEQSGKRDRKKVERFVQEVKKEELKPTGTGICLGDIPFIEAQITKTQAEDLKILHRICFGRAGTPAEIKKNLRKFNGFPFTKDDKKYSSKVSAVEKVVLPELKKLLIVLGLERGGNKAEVCERFINFMMNPVDSGKKPPRIKNKNKSGRARGRPKKGSEKKASASASSSGEDSSEVSSDEDSEGEEEEKEKPKKPVKKTPAKASKTPSKTPAKKTPKKTPAKKSKVQIASDSDSDSDDEPLAKKVCKPPSDAEIKSVIKKILDGANLEEVTMKTVCKQVYENYPDFDLSHKKAFIKETVRTIIS